MNLLKISTACAALALFCASSFAKNTPVQGLEEYKLENGLTLFTLEDHSVPLAHVEIAFRTGSTDQTLQNEGLFYLYEQLMFNGNELYPTAQDVTDALAEMGVTSYNSKTSSDSVYFHITVPSNQVEQALTFWNAAARTPNLQENSFLTAKRKLSITLQHYASQQYAQLISYKSIAMFPSAPWRTSDYIDSLQIENIKNATANDILDLQAKYFIPKNAAVIVGGDISPQNVLELTQKIFGTWSNKSASQEAEEFTEYAPLKQQEQSLNPLKETSFAVHASPDTGTNLALVSVLFRGPDTDFDLEGTYTADFLTSALRAKSNILKTELAKNKELNLSPSENILTSYITKRADGLIEFSIFLADPEDSIAERIKALPESLKLALNNIALQDSMYAKESVQNIVGSLTDMGTLAEENVSGRISTLRFWWACADSGYYYSYNSNLSLVTKQSVARFLEKYVNNSNPLVSVTIPQGTYESQKQSFQENGYELITKENSIPSKNSSSGQESREVKTYRIPEFTELYRPRKEASKTNLSLYSQENSLKVQKLRLNNGIPVYIKNNPLCKVDSVCIGIKGGLSRLTPKTSGLADALLTLSGRSSKNYNAEQRKALEEKYSSSIKIHLENEGFGLSLKVLDSRLKDALPLLTDSFLNPDLSTKALTPYYEELSSALQKTNETSSILSYAEYNSTFLNHPYEPLQSVTLESLPSITEENLKKLHESFLNPSSLFVVAYGNMDAQELVQSLNSTLGSLEQSMPIYTETAVPPVKIRETGPFKINCKQGENICIASRVFALPQVQSSDYEASRIAASIYADVLSKVVKEKHFVCQTSRSTVIPAKASVGEEYFFVVKDFEKLQSYAEEARILMSLGKIVTSSRTKKGYLYSELYNVLQRYKNFYINSIYSLQNSSLGQANAMFYNVLEYNTADYTKEKLKQIEEITAEDVMRVFQRYWIDSPSRWYVALPKE